MKKWYSSKTVWMGLVVAILGVLEFVQSSDWMDLKTTVIGALIVFLRGVTSMPLGSDGPKRDKKGRFTSTSILFGVVILALVGCGTLHIKAKDSAHCKFQVKAPHKVTCTVDGKVVYAQEGPKDLDIKGCCRCEE